MLNSDLDALGLSDTERTVYWFRFQEHGAFDKVDPSNRQAILDAYAQAISDLETIRSVNNPTEAQQTWAVQREADILEKLLKFLKTEIGL